MKLGVDLSVYEWRSLVSVGRLFSIEKMDTMDIARSTGCTEADAYNTLIVWRELRRLQVWE